MTWAIAGLSAALLVAALWVALAHPGPATLGETALATVMAGVPTAAGLLVARRRPGNRLAPLLAFAGFAAALLLGGEVLDAGPEPPGAEYLTVAAQGAWTVFYAAIVLLVLFFPGGRLSGKAGRWLVTVMLADVGTFLVLAATAPGPFMAPNQDAPHVFGTMPERLSQVLALTVPGLLAVLVATTLVSIGRYRRADPAERAQWKWLALGASLLPLTLLSCWASYLLLGTADIVLVGLVLMYAGIPAVIAIALLWPTMLDVDRALSATVTHGVLTAVLLGVFTAVEVLAGLMLGAASVVVAVVATALCAALLTPLRRRLQSKVDSRLYPARAAATVALEALRRRTSALQEAPENLQDVLREALGDPGLRVAFVAPDQASSKRVDAAGRPVGRAPEAVHVLLDGALIGELSSARTSRDLLREVAVIAAPIVEVVRLRLELRRALAEVELSRARLLRIGYEERRRLERDLHDGAQQRLVSLGMSLRLAQRRLGRPHDAEGVDVEEVLDGAVAELGTAVSELRQLAHGIRPSCLDDGLASALSGLVSSVPITVALEVAARQLPDDVETTAYFVACEAVSNAVKHARAQHIQIRIDARASQLYISIRDDGVGGAERRDGSGLAGLEDRVAAHGGVLHVASPPGLGTTLEVVLPCAS